MAVILDAATAAKMRKERDAVKTIRRNAAKPIAKPRTVSDRDDRIAFYTSLLSFGSVADKDFAIAKLTELGVTDPFARRRAHNAVRNAEDEAFARHRRN